MSSHSGHRSNSTVASASGSSVVAAATSSTAAKAAGHAKSSPEHPEYVWYGILALLALATVANACYLSWVTYRRYRAHRGASQGSSTTSKPGGTGRLFLRRVPQAILSASRIFGFRWRIPGLDLMMVEVLVTIAYMTACLVWCFGPVDGLTYPSNLAGKSWGSRTGMLATIQLPFIVLLATKNNPITWLTGIGHEKLNLMHRVVSRCVLVITWLHLGGEYLRSPAKLISANWKIAGAIALAAQTVTTLISNKWFRRRFYETFYVSHVILIVIFLVTAHIHVAPKGYAKYIWGVWAIWLFDRLFRGGRYVLFNLILRPSTSNARIETIGADGLRITLRRRVPGGWKAGQHVFLAFPTLGLQSHPFTIGNIYEPSANEKAGETGAGAEAEMVFTIRAMQGQTRVLSERAAPTGSCELPAMIDGPYGHPEDLRPFATCVFIAGGTGVTYTFARMQQLFRDLKASDACAQRVVFVWAVRSQTEYEWIAADLEKAIAEAPPTLSLAVDIYLTGGPRGTDAALRSLPALDKSFDAEADAEGDIDLEKGPLSPTSECSSASLDEKCAARSRLDRPPPPRLSPSSSDTRSGTGTETPSGSLQLKRPEAVYFTSGSTTPTECVTTEGGGGAFPLALSGAQIRRRCGRPDVYRILEEEVTASSGTVAVDVSGPDVLVDHVRRALCAPFAGPVAALKGTPTVMLSVEQFRM